VSEQLLNVPLDSRHIIGHFRDDLPRQSAALVMTSRGSVYRKTEPIADILKYRYQHRYLEYRKIKNIDNKNTESRFGIFCICLQAVLKHFMLTNMR